MPSAPGRDRAAGRLRGPLQLAGQQQIEQDLGKEKNADGRRKARKKESLRRKFR